MNFNKIIRIIENEFAHGKIKQVGWIELIEKLENRGYKQIDIDDALDEAERRKVIQIEGGYCRWIDPNLRKSEKTKTQKRFQLLAEIFREGHIDFLSREDLETALKERGFDEEEILRVIAEAERDHVLYFISRSLSPGKKLVRGCIWIPPKDRKKEAEADRHQREWFEKNLEKKAFEEERWE